MKHNNNYNKLLENKKRHQILDKAFNKISNWFLGDEQIYDNDGNLSGNPEKIYLYWVSLGECLEFDKSIDYGRRELKKMMKDKGFFDSGKLRLKYLAVSGAGTIRRAMGLNPIEPWD